MIKLKKFVNVKELYKLGFKRLDYSNLLFKKVKVNEYGFKHTFNLYYINTKDGTIEIMTDGHGYDYIKSVILDDTLYQLFKADLLEVRDD